MENLYRCCLIITKKILGVNAVCFHRKDEVYETLIRPHLFFASQFARNSGDFHQMMQYIDEDALYEIQDRAEVLWLIFSSKGQVFVIGPYLDELPQRASQLQILNAIGLDEAALDGLRDYHASIPVGVRSQALLAADAIMDCLDIPSERPPLTRIVLSNTDSPTDEQGAEHQYPPGLFIERTHDVGSKFMEAVSLGNLSEALLLLQEVLVRNRPRDGKVTLYREQVTNTIIRTMVRLAARGAGVPSMELDALTQEYCLRTESARSIEQAERLMYELTERICSLVSKQRLSSYSPLVKKAMHQVNQRLHEKLSVIGIARDTGVSPNYLSARFHKEYGQKLSAYITDMRMQRAAKLLRNSNMSILDICMSVGISDSSYFSRQFKAKYKMSPSNYRKAPLSMED